MASLPSESQARSTLPTPPIARPITFVTPLVQAILAGRKTQTRRIVAPQPDLVGVSHDAQPVVFARGKAIRCPFGTPGQELWVRERWAPASAVQSLYQTANQSIVYAADATSQKLAVTGWKPARFMPRRYSRLSLRIRSIRVERLTDLTVADARAEGFDPTTDGPDSIGWFRRTWDTLAAEQHQWPANPVVWVIEFQPLLDQPL